MPDTDRTSLANVCSCWSPLANSEGRAEGILSRHPLKKCQKAQSVASVHWKELKTTHGVEFTGALSLIPNEGFTRVVLVHEHK